MFGREHNQKSLVCEKKIVYEGALSNLRQFLAIKSPLKTMKNAFSFSRYLNFCLEFLAIL